MKTCTKCKEEKMLEEFYKDSKSKDGKSRWCGACLRSARNANYATAAGKAKNDAYGKRMREKNRIFLFEYMLEHPCVDCGEGNPIVLEFDHKDPAEKSFGIGGSGMLFKSWNTVLKEIEKCDVRCANCHKIKTATQFGWYKAQRWAEHNSVVEHGYANG